MPVFFLTRAAKADLKSIAVHTQRRWGREQRRLYIEQFDRALSLNPNNVEALNGKGVSAVRNRDYGLAIEMFTQASQKAPSNGGFYLNLAIVPQEPERYIGLLVHEIAHDDGNGHDKEWGKAMQRGFEALIKTLYPLLPAHGDQCETE